MLTDLRQALRGFGRTPGLTAAAVLSLALGIGANTAIFSVAWAILAKPLPYKDANRLAILWNRSPGLDILEDWFSTAQYFDIATRTTSFETLAIALGANYNLTDADREPERVGGIRVSSNLLPMLGAAPLHGRLFRPDEDRPGQAPVAILGANLWARRYGGDPKVVGTMVTLNGARYEVVGVLPPEFSLPREVLPTLGVAEDGDVFLPLPLAADAATIRTREDYNIMGALKPGVPVARAQAELDVLTASLRAEHPDVYPPNGGLTFSIVPLREQVSGKITRPLYVLVGAVAVVLLIACVNVALLLLARAEGRRAEFAVRTAIGGSRARLARQLLVEGLVLAVTGGAVGLALAAGVIRWIHAVRPADVPRLDHIGLDLPVFAFAALVSAIAAIAFSLAPARGAGRLDVNATLKDGARGASGAGLLWGRGGWRRHALVAGELALAVIVVTAAALFARSVAALERVPPGFDPAGVVTVELTLTGAKYKDGPAVIAGYRALWDRLRALPGVEAAGGVTSLPMSGFFAWGPITAEGRQPVAGEKFLNADMRSVGGDYFAAMRIPLVRGRVFDDRDWPVPSAESPARSDMPDARPARVVVIDARLAREVWPGQDPIGKRLKYGDAASTSPWETVIGVVGEVKQYGPGADARIALYRPHGQSPSRALFVTVRGRGDADTLTGEVSRAVRAFDADLPLYHLQPMTARVAAATARERFATTLLTVFAALALALAATGTLGVWSYQVARGTRDIGIRLALGATPGDILRLVLGRGALVGAAGLTAGVAGALALSRWVESMLFGVTARDPLTLGAVTAGLAVIALCAALVPARRAARVDPARVLGRAD